MAGTESAGVVAAGHPLTAAAGAEILSQGGNAFDAAIAAVLTAWVTESVLTSAGGGGFLLAHTAQGHQCLFDFFTQTPRHRPVAFKPDFYPIEANFGDAVQEFHVGLGSIAVPGNVAGMWHIHQRLGRLPMAAIAAPAIRHAQAGVPVNQFMAYCFNLLRPILSATESSRAIYAPQGKLLGEGDRLHLPDMAATLQALVREGPGLFYEGELAQRLVQDSQAYGGYLSAADLSHYRVLERQPLTLNYRGHTLMTNPPPSSGGTLIAFALALLAGENGLSAPWGTAQHLHHLAHAMALTNEARRDGYDDRLYEGDVAEWFLSASHLQRYQSALSQVVNKWGSTTHISVLDREGNAASVTSSNGEGSTYVIPGTQIMLNNMLGEADLHPHGFHQWHPHQRISSMMAPTVVLQGDRPRLVIGSGGSNRIRTAILQVISNLLDFQQPLTTAVTAPRIHWEAGHLHCEPGYSPAAIADLIQSLDRSPTLGTLCPWQQPNMFFGGVHAVSQGVEGGLDGAGDPRRGGAVAIATSG
jgi:gamma-glutamyltranspeptidase/glutathione hydrolase